MDGDSSHKAMKEGANAQATMDDVSIGGNPKAEPLGEKTTGSTPVFNSQGTVGKQFTSGGMLGGTAEKVGGPFSSQGAVGSQFTEGGSIGGTMQEQLGKGQNTTFNK